MGVTVKAALCILLIYASSGITLAIWSWERTIGIDLGMTYCSVGFYRNGKVEIIEDEQGNRISPSCVAFTDKDILIGEPAKNQSDANPERTICEVNRLLGRKFDDPEIQRDLKLLPYKVVPRDGKPYIMMKRDGEVVVFSPKDISAMILRNIKERAEAYLGKKVNEAVITVPAHVNREYVDATRAASTVAGFHEIRILEEPIAASMAYGLHKEVDKNVLVFNLGSTTLEISVLTNDGFSETTATSHDSRLGGIDFDHRVLDYFVKLIKKEYNKDISKDKEALRKLLRECERAITALGSQTKVLVEIDSLYDGVDLSEVLTRLMFETLNIDLLKKMIELTKRALGDSNLKKSDIHEIVLVGGGSRILNVRQLLKNFFYGRKLLDEVNPDEAVVHGAAIKGGETNESGFFYGAPNLYWTPLSLGIETVGGVMTRVIPRDTIIPTKKSLIVTTYQDQQTSVLIKIYDGERALAKDCRELGSFNFSEIAPAPRGIPQIEVTFNIDWHGRLHVMAEDKATGKLKSITISDFIYLSGKETRLKIKEAEKFADEDSKIIDRIEARKKLETLFSIKSSIHSNDKLTEKIVVEGKENLNNAFKDVMGWLDELDKKVRDWDALLSPVMEKSSEVIGSSSGHHDEL